MTSAFVILLWRFCLAWPGLLVPDAGSYAPVTILIDERSDGVRISYDRMTRFLAPYGNAEALEVARDLDCKVEALLNSVA